jgi:hypothetical protein
LANDHAQLYFVVADDALGYLNGAAANQIGRGGLEEEERFGRNCVSTREPAKEMGILRAPAFLSSAAWAA